MGSKGFQVSKQWVASDAQQEFSLQHKVLSRGSDSESRLSIFCFGSVLRPNWVRQGKVNDNRDVRHRREREQH